jgi:hypothetical protein
LPLGSWIASSRRAKRSLEVVISALPSAVVRAAKPRFGLTRVRVVASLPPDPQAMGRSRDRYGGALLPTT